VLYKSLTGFEDRSLKVSPADSHGGGLGLQNLEGAHQALIDR